MKKLIMLFAAILMVACFSNKVMSQTAVTATLGSNVANATVLSAISLTNPQVLEFGAFVPHGTHPGTVTMGVADDRTYTEVTLVEGTVIEKSARFITAGTKLAAYTITIPLVGFNITNTSGIGNETMEITAMDCTGTLTHQIDAGGTDVFYVGGTLAVAAAQAPGLYTGTYAVTVAY